MIHQNLLKNIFFLFCFFINTVLAGAQEEEIIAKGAKLVKAGTGYSFTEGPAVSPDGKVFFSDQPNDRIYVWDKQKGISLWLEGTRRSNGMYFNNSGQLVTCADLYNQLGYFDESKEFQLIHEGYNGKPLNAPNDLWISPGGGIYFTDPYYHRKWWDEDRSEEQKVRGVYYLSPEGKITRVISDFKQPNGLIGSPDGKTLYVADINDKKIWRYSILQDGSLANKTYFAPHGSDGMTIDTMGNIYLTMGKVWVYSPEGILIEEIEVPENPSNVCFGGKERNRLFITARTSVYTLKMKVKGVK